MPVPEPHADAGGEICCSRCKGKPAAVVDRLPGEHHLAPDAADCASVGTMLARMHLAGADFAPYQPNLRGLAWWTETVPVVLPHLDAAQARADRATSSRYQQHLAASPAYAALPRGAIHGDLFRDNVMFDGRRARRRVRLLLRRRRHACCSTSRSRLNDWCIDLESGRLVEERAEALRRRLRRACGRSSSAELRLLPALMRAARVPLLALAPVGPAPAARRRRAEGARPDPLRARAAQRRDDALASATPAARPVAS